jgi:predicted DNA-binding transcriptional regulator AlpA
MHPHSQTYPQQGHQFVEAHTITPVSAADGSRIELLTTKEVASMLRVSCGWVRDHASGRRRPKLQCVKLGKAIRFRLADVTNFIEECCGNAA